MVAEGEGRWRVTAGNWSAEAQMVGRGKPGRNREAWKGKRKRGVTGRPFTTYSRQLFNLDPPFVCSTIDDYDSWSAMNVEFYGDIHRAIKILFQRGVRWLKWYIRGWKVERRGWVGLHTMSANGILARNNIQQKASFPLCIFHNCVRKHNKQQYYLRTWKHRMFLMSRLRLKMLITNVSWWTSM
jgi:hypothetical protein